MTDIPMFDCFVILFAREKSHRKKWYTKMWYNGKAFYYKAGTLF